MNHAVAFLIHSRGTDIIIPRNMRKSQFINNEKKAHKDILNSLLGYAFLRVFPQLSFSEITRIAINPHHQKQGLGSQLLTHIQLFLKTLSNQFTIELEVAQKNTVAHHFYKKNDFYLAGKRKKYYKDGDNALILVKKLEKCKFKNKNTSRTQNEKKYI